MRNAIKSMTRAINLRANPAARRAVRNQAARRSTNS